MVLNPSDKWIKTSCEWWMMTTTTTKSFNLVSDKLG
jgi:hypothetical protein